MESSKKRTLTHDENAGNKTIYIMELEQKSMNTFQTLDQKSMYTLWKQQGAHMCSGKTASKEIKLRYLSGQYIRMSMSFLPISQFTRIILFFFLLT